MKDAKDQILKSLDGMDQHQMDAVLQYIRRMALGDRQWTEQEKLKARAIKEIRQALSDIRQIA